MDLSIKIIKKPFADLATVIMLPMAFEILYFSVVAVIAWIPFLALFSYLILFPLAFLVIAWVSCYIVNSSMKKLKFSPIDATILGFLEATFSAAMFLLIFFLAAFLGVIMINFLFPSLLNTQGFDILLFSFYVAAAWLVIGAGIMVPVILGRTVFCLIVAFLLKKTEIAESKKVFVPEK